MTNQQLIVLAVGCLIVVSLIVTSMIWNLKNKIAERDKIITNFINQERDRHVYAVMKNVIAYFERFFEESGADAKQALYVITMKHKNRALIEFDGSILCPAYLELLDSVATLNPLNFSRIEAFQEFLKKVYAYTYLQYGHEQPSKYISRMRGSLLRHELEAHEEGLEKM